MYSRFPDLRVVAGLLLLAACHREERRLGEPPPTSQAPRSITMSDIRPGANTALDPQPSPYESNAHAISQGRQLFEWFNCVGCHAYGGGGIGPPLMDDQWIYGSAPENIYATIVQGRPNGMPAFGGRIPDQQVWQLVAYVRSLGGQVRKDAEPARSDHLFTRKSGQSMRPMTPRSSSPPPEPPK